MDGTMTADECAAAISNGNRGDARLAIRMHPDPAHFVLEVLDVLNDKHPNGYHAVLIDLRRLLSV